MSDKQGTSGTAKKQCLRAARLGYWYDDKWKTPIHKFARSSEEGDPSGFLTTRPEYLLAGEGKTLSDLATELNSGKGSPHDDYAQPESSKDPPPKHTYDARIYSHFQGGKLDLDFGNEDASHESHRIEKRRFLARAVELEVKLYLDSLHFWTLHCMHPTSTKTSWADLTVPDEELAWWTLEQHYWSSIATNSASGDPSGNSATNVLRALAHSKSVSDLEAATTSFATDSNLSGPHSRQERVSSNGYNLSSIIRPQEHTRHDRFWAEGVCETLRETTLFQTGVPRLMQAIVTNIPRSFWIYASGRDAEKSSEAAMQLLTWTATSLVFHFQHTMRKHSANQNVSYLDRAERALQAALFHRTGNNLRPKVVREQHWIDDLLKRIDNVVELMAKHALLLHETIEESFKLHAEGRESKKRLVDGVRPPEPEKVLCFIPPGHHRKKQCNDKCQVAKCRQAACSQLPCSDRGCRADEVVNREFMRQLREQQATLNGTPRQSLDANLQVLSSARAKKLRPHTKGVIAARTAEWDGNENNAARPRVSAYVAYKKDAGSVPLYRNIKEAIAEQLRGHNGKASKELKAEAREKVLSNRYEEIRQQLARDNSHWTEQETRAYATQQLQAEVFKGLHGLHALDSVALGNLFQVLGMGDGEANSAIGTQWGNWAGHDKDGVALGPSEKLQALKDGLAKLSPPLAFPNFELVVCPRPCPANPNNKKTATPTTP